MNKKISALFVDDSEEILEIVRALSEDTEIQIITSTPDKLSTVVDSFLFDILYVDIHMGSKTEPAHAAVLKYAEEHNVPVVLVTGEVLRSAYEGMAVAQKSSTEIRKPFRIQDFLIAAESCLKKSA